MTLHAHPGRTSRAPRARLVRSFGAILTLCSLPIAAATEPAFGAVAVSQHAHPFAGNVTEAGQRFGIPETWIWRVMHAESRGNPRAVSRAGAMGLMQIMPATWQMLSARHRLGTDPFDARANIHAGAAYLRQMWDRYRDVRLMLAAYNAGPGRADAYATGKRGLPAETVAYVAQILPSLRSSSGAADPSETVTAVPSWRGASIFAVAREASSTEPANGEVAPALRHQGSLFIPLSGRAE